MIQHLSAGLIAAMLLTSGGQGGQSPSPTPRDLYAAALAREQAVRAHAGTPGPTLQEYREAVSAYDAVVRQFPQSGYVDNALWQGGTLANEAFDRFAQPRDRATARRMLRLLVSDYPVSPFVKKAREVLQQMDDRDASAAQAAAPAPQAPMKLAVLRSITRTVMPDRVRVTLDLDAAATYRSERVEDPPRVLVDLKETRPGPAVALGTLSYKDGVASQVRVGLPIDHVTRVVVSLDGVSGYHISMFEQPYRIIIDCDRGSAAAARPETPAAPPKPAAVARTADRPAVALLPSRAIQRGSHGLPAIESFDAALLHAPDRASEPVKATPVAPEPVVSVTPPAAAAKTAIPPAAPIAGGRGRYSMTRQLGLGVSKIVIDPGHGGHDPGALGAGISEAEVVLDVALRLETLLKQAGVEVVLTRRTDEYVPLEERPAIAKHEQADLFLSIHANASRTRTAHGVETYFLNFSTDPAAEAVAARENAATSRTINDLPDILKAITLNNKLDESRSFADLIQNAMATQLRGANSAMKSLGVKQAPFVVLIGADMPSVLVEIAFITNPQEGRLLKSSAYRQKIAQALFDAVRGYQKSLKSEPVAMRH